MPSYAKFQSDNNKYTDKTSRLRTNNPDFNPTIQVNGKKENAHFMRNLKRWSDLVAYFRWYPDIFLDWIRPTEIDEETGKIRKLGIELGRC